MWKKQECLRLKIKRILWGPRRRFLTKQRRRSVCRSAGKVEIVLGMFAFLMVLVVMLAGLKISQIMITGAYVEDALAASNLASALIDVEAYGKSREILIRDVEAAYDLYLEALAVNLKLDEEGRSAQRGLLTGQVEVLSYIIYNVSGSQVDIYEFSAGSALQSSQGILGQVYTPDGVRVETTTIYSCAAFGVEGFLQQPVRAKKEKSVDIKRDENESGG